jgi:antitoxin (DNA-binding transcriptional repressor) of toxin-antitoxin stability system
LANVARCSYNSFMTSTGIRELKDNLSHYVRRTEAGERIAVTAHGRVVAELGPPTAASTGQGRGARYEDLVAAGVARPALEPGDPLADWPDLRLPKGTAAHLIDSDRGEA